MTRRFEILETRIALHGDHFFHSGMEQIPNYVVEPDTVSVRDGDWFDAATWSNGIPDLSSDVRIDHHVTISRPPLLGDVNFDGAVDVHDCLSWLEGYSKQSPSLGDADRNGAVDHYDLHIILDAWFNPSPHWPQVAVAEDINVNGQLSFSPDDNTSLHVQTLTVTGTLQVGTEQAPITASAEIVFRDAPIDQTFDPQQLGHGLLVIETGTITVNGRDNTPFAELRNASAGGTTITLAEPVIGWLPGDELFLPDTRALERHEFSEAETVVIASIDGLEVTLEAPLAYSHQGGGGNLPHAAHMSGNITFRSENPDGVRGHILVAERSSVDVRDAVFQDLGRTTAEQLDNTHLGPNREIRHVGGNQVGRYSFHIHHLYGPEITADEYQYRFSGNVLRDGRKWGLAIHDSHFGRISENVVVGMDGSGIVFEDGSEFGNVVDHNFVGLIRGSGEKVQGRANGVESRLVGDGTPENPYRTEGDHGHEGAGIWARSASNHITNNVVTNSKFGTVFWSRFQGNERIPAFPGADTNVDYVIVAPGQQLDHEFRGNEFYGMSLAASWQGLSQETPGGVFLASDMRVWNVWDVLDASYSDTIRFEGGEFNGVRSFATMLGFTDRIELDGVTVVGFRSGVFISEGGSVKDSYFACVGSDIIVEYEKTETHQRQVVIDGARFADDKNNITYRLGDYFNKRSYTAPLDVLVYDYNGVSGDDFQLWMPEQSAKYVMPARSPGQVRGNRMSAEEGLSNQKLWEKYRLTLAGKILPPTAATREGVNGLVTPIQSDLRGPTIADLKVVVKGGTATISWRTDEPATSQVEWSDGEITIEKYANLLRADTKLRTEHKVKLTGLELGKDYQFLIRVFDANGNLGGHTHLGGLKYAARSFKTALQ